MGAKVSSGGGDSKKLELSSEPNVIPFVDIMLVLLIIFMVAAPIATVDIGVSLPGSKVIPSKRPNKPTFVTIQDQGGGAVRYYVGNTEVDQYEIGKATLPEVQKNDRTLTTFEDVIQERIYIRADGVTRYRNVVFAMNRLQDEGFFKVSLVGEDKRGLGRRRG
jgi:biopolymer transport protein ExbD